MTPSENPPRANVTEVFAYWIEGRKKKVGPVSTDGTVILSYDEPLVARAPTGHVLMAERKPGSYTHTTAQHLSGLHELMSSHGELEVAMVDRDAMKVARYGGDGIAELVIQHFDQPLRQNPRRRDLEENPPWATRLIADSLVTLQEQVPPKWLPKLEATAASGKGNKISAELVEYGCGAYGCVMPTLDKDVVLKLTSDPSEAKFATEIADTLPTPCVTHYHLAVKLSGAERSGREVFLLWRESAEDVGKIHKVVGMHAEKLIRKQHRAAVDAYMVLAEGGEADEFLELLELWKKRCMEMAALPELEFVAMGMLRAWNEKGVFISDTHGGNLGRCIRNGTPTWVITDPGNVVLSTQHADEHSRRRGRQFEAYSPGYQTARELNPKRPACTFDYGDTVEGRKKAHDQLRADDEAWSKAEPLGRQLSYDDSDNEIYLELRNCACGSTLARPEQLEQNPRVPKRGAVAFFEQYASASYPVGTQPRFGRRRSARDER